MKTDDLVAVLSKNSEPVDRGEMERTVFVALCVGLLFALGIMIIGLGMRADLATARALIFLCLKVAFALGIVAIATVFLIKLARPGGERNLSSWLVALPFTAIALIAAINLGFAPKSHWDKMIMGDDWLECLLSIPIIAVAPFAIAIWAVRRAAPTHLVLTGAFTGLVAGGVSAMAYALHCSDDSLPFIAIWYGSTIVLCTLAGAVFGPRLLRW
ncbi:MAG: DUF1109 domain-containing protein [Rhizobiales bacterium]|nr:DUF1109 domain-containing protein [Hyphomicrobiales bacterium]